eukprot:195268_1
MSNLSKCIPQRVLVLVYGYLRECEDLFSAYDSNPYYNIPDLVKHLCLSFYHIKESWDKNYHGKTFKIIDENICIKTGNKWESVYLTNIVSEGTHHWRFKILELNQSALNSKPEIGIFKMKDDRKLKVDTYFLSGIDRGYSFSTAVSKLSDPETGGRDKKYGSTASINDFIDMYLDLNELVLSWGINGKYFGKAFDVEKCQYKAAVALYSTCKLQLNQLKQKKK